MLKYWSLIWYQLATWYLAASEILRVWQIQCSCATFWWQNSPHDILHWAENWFHHLPCLPVLLYTRKQHIGSTHEDHSLIWNLLWLAIVAFMGYFPPCYFPAFLQFPSHFKFEISGYCLWTILSESSVCLLNNIDGMENSLRQHGIASWSKLNEDYIW
jgi:hypothetical protein